MRTRASPGSWKAVRCVEAAHDGLELPREHRVLHLVGELEHRVDFLVGLLALLAKRLEGLVHGVVATHPGTDGLCTLCLLETAEVELEVLVVVVDRGDGRILLLVLFLGVEDEDGKVLEDDELERHDVVGVHPVLGGLTHKGRLVAAGARVALDGVAAGTDEVEELGELDDELVVVLLVEGARGEVVLYEFLAEETAGLLVVLLDDLVEAGVVELGEEGEVVYVCDDDGEALFELEEALLVCVAVLGVRVELVVGAGVVSCVDDVAVRADASAFAMRSVLALGIGAATGRGARVGARRERGGGIGTRRDEQVDFGLGLLDALSELLDLDLLEVVDLVELLAEDGDELVLILICPSAVVLCHATLDLLLELRVLEVLVGPLGTDVPVLAARQSGWLGRQLHVEVAVGDGCKPRWMCVYIRCSVGRDAEGWRASRKWDGMMLARVPDTVWAWEGREEMVEWASEEGGRKGGLSGDGSARPMRRGANARCSGSTDGAPQQ
ncbi:hypothetical protein L1887_43987 [Cichorium endivia]|nr:hypothetical protein L1887_43987 [Cichorium endivia]